MRNFLALIITVISISAYGQVLDVSRLVQSFNNLQTTNSLQNQQEFFYKFPSTFDSFENTFGFSSKGKAPLYDDYMKYIPAFFDLESIPLKTQMDKWISISIYGKWDADGVNLFQSYVYKRSLSHTELMYRQLKFKSKTEIESYFYFLFDSVHPDILTIPNEFDFINEKDPPFYSLIQSAHKSVMDEAGHEH